VRTDQITNMRPDADRNTNSVCSPDYPDIIFSLSTQPSHLYDLCQLSP